VEFLRSALICPSKIPWLHTKPGKKDEGEKGCTQQKAVSENMEKSTRSIVSKEEGMLIFSVRMAQWGLLYVSFLKPFRPLCVMDYEKIESQRAWRTQTGESEDVRRSSLYHMVWARRFQE
jgi:hypothetical protein